MRCVDETAPRAGLVITSISACTAAAAIAASGVPLQLTAGWLDSTAGPAICMFTHAAKAPGAAPTVACSLTFPMEVWFSGVFRFPLVLIIAEKRKDEHAVICTKCETACVSGDFQA